MREPPHSIEIRVDDVPVKVEQETKKKSRRLAKFQRAIAGATLEDIMKKRNQKPEVRKAQREQAIR